MYLDLRDVSEKSERFERTYVASAFTSAKEDYLVKDDVSLVFDVRKTQEKYHLVGRLVTSIDLICCRCLEAYPRAVDSAFDLLYFPQVRNNGDGEFEVEEAALAVAFYRDEEIDLGQLVREQLYLLLPMKPLCVENCLGLCPICGINLNRDNCQCSTTWHDSRLADLKSVLDKR